MRIFVFGSNMAGIHGAGSALEAKRNWGAEMGVGRGRTGNAYAIPTKDMNLRTLPITTIRVYVDQFIRYAIDNPNIDFEVVAIGTGLAGYTHGEMAPLFLKAPDNCWLHTEWNKILGRPE